MTGEGFDAVVAALARARTRRAAVAALASAVALGTALDKGTPASAGQATVAPCRGKQAKCRKNAHCCSGRCRKRRGKNKNRKKGKCRCSRHLERCHKDSDCCALGGMPLVCVDGTCET
ncbi:MAG: hypothetical protein ACRDJC_20370 [Thermomicrobiales bacterium]